MRISCGGMSGVMADFETASPNNPTNLLIPAIPVNVLGELPEIE